MKPKSIYIAGAVATFLIFSSGSLWAQRNVVDLFTIKGAAIEEQGSVTIGQIRTTPPPIKLSITTKSLMLSIAIFKSLQGSYNGPVPFPAGAKLVAVQTWGSNPTYFIVDKNNNAIVNVSDILVSARTGAFGVDIHSGTFNTVSNLAAPSQTFTELYLLSYNDTGLAGSAQVRFNFIGMCTHTRSDTTVKNGLFTETQGNKIGAAAGDGSAQGFPLTVTGSFSSSGKTVLVF